jgi:excisionase family DNA binding protein
MQIGDETVYTLTEAATRLGIKRGTLLTQVRRGLVAAEMVGSVYLITASELVRYDEQRKQPRGFARPDHPLHGKQGPGHRRKKGDSQDLP